VKLAVVVQRYGLNISGGAELHARYVVEHLARHAEVEVVTTCAADYVTWKNELPPGRESVNGVLVRRFPVRHERDPITFGRRSERVFENVHSLAEELDWLDAEGPTSPSLVDYLQRHGNSYDFCIFFSCRYYHAYYGARETASRAVLVPTAEREPSIGLSMFGPVFRGVRAIMYNSHEERAMIQTLSGNQSVPGVVVGVGSEVPGHPQPLRFRNKHRIHGPYMLYVGRIDENKGCRELFDFFQSHLLYRDSQLSLVLIGNTLLPIPEHPQIRFLGFLDDTDKFDAIAGAELLVMPSYFESLSMVVLEAWALGTPVLVNGACDVLRGQCLRSNGGLYYENRTEFLQTLHVLVRNRRLNTALGNNGRRYFAEHYAWPVVERKYLDLLERLAGEPPSSRMEPLPGWLERRRQQLPPAREVLDRVPRGPVRVSAVAEKSA
jgi:glycosyltransferase involved in cell wall biosynthesis